MSWHAWFAIAVVAGTLSTLVFTRWATHLVMLAAMTVLLLAGVIDAQSALAGFANPGLVTVAAMFVVAAGVHGSGGIDLLVNHVLGKPKSLAAAMLRIAVPVSLLSGFLNNTPVVATMIPAVKRWAGVIQQPVSKLYIPLSYAAILGGTLTMIGTSTNLVVNGQVQQLTGTSGFGLFDITMIGVPVLITGVAMMWLFFPKWLPRNDVEHVFANKREFTLEVCVSPNGPLVGKSIKAAGLRALGRVFLVEIGRGNNIISAVPPTMELRGGDRLVFAGETDAVSDLLHINGLEPSVTDSTPVIDRNDPDRRLVEVVVSQHCSAIGEAIRDSKFRERYGAVVLAVARNGQRVQGNLSNITLTAGDTLLLEARSAFVSRQRYNRDFLLVNDLEAEPPRYGRAYLAWLILAGVVLAAATGVLSMLQASLLGALGMVVSGCCSVSQAEKSLDLPVLLTIAASFALGAALKETGVAQTLASVLVSWGQGNAWLLLILTYLMVVLLTEVITNNAAALLALPIVMHTTELLGVPYEPYVMAIMIAASASFITPLGYQTNLMVYGPGGYRFADFIKVGIPMSLLVGTVAIITIGLVYSL